MLIETGRARPKSSSLTPCGVMNTLDGFRSRWMMPRWCSASSAERIPSVVDTASGAGIAPSVQPITERSAFEELHGEEGLAGVLADLEQLTDVRVIDGRGRARFPEESLAHRRVRRWQDGLDRNGALELIVHALENDTHATASDLTDDPITADAVGNRGGI